MVAPNVLSHSITVTDTLLRSVTYQHNGHDDDVGGGDDGEGEGDDDGDGEVGDDGDGDGRFPVKCESPERTRLTNCTLHH